VNARVCILTTVHRATDTRIYAHEAAALADAGYSTVLVAPWQDDVLLGHGVEYVPIRRIRSRSVRLVRSAFGMARLAKKQAADVYHIHDSELLLVGNLLARAGFLVIYDVHEDLPAQILGKSWIPPALRRPLSCVADKLELRLSRRLSGIVVATPAIARRFQNPVIVGNYPDLDRFPTGSGEIAPQGGSDVFFVGGITRARGAEIMIRAMGHLPRELDATLHLVGRMEPESFLEELQAIRGAERVRFVGELPWSRAWEQAVNSQGIGLLLYQPRPNHTEALPTKLFEYMAASMPVIASNFPLWQEIVLKHECGLVVNPTDPLAVAHAIRALLADGALRRKMGANGRQAIEREYNWGIERMKLLDLYGRIVS